MFGREGKNQTPDLEVFAIYDDKVEAYSDPKFAINQHDFTRTIINTFREPAHSQSKYLVNAEDYSLFKIGNYSFKEGRLESIKPVHICNFHELRATALRLNAESKGQSSPGALELT